jgi:ferredoxin-thioredoxin reductase catalytic subunit
LARVTVDTTVQPKDITFPTDAKLLHAAIKGLTRLARKRGVRLRQSYVRIAKRAAMMAGVCPCHARASFTNACFISMIWSSRERNTSRSLASRRSRGRIANPPLHLLEREESWLAIRGNPKIDLQGSRPPKARNRQIRLLERWPIIQPIQ